MGLLSNLRKNTATTTNTKTNTKANQPIEVGTVNWLRDLDLAREQSMANGKPIFLLFQEVPGCAGCKQFGADVLSNSSLVDTIEDLFVPMMVRNNVGGEEAKILESFGEPAWNYQVVRFIDPNLQDIIARKDKVWETGPLAARMIQALIAHGKEVPDYLRLIEQEHSDRLERVHFAQGCFWVGETELGRINGVVKTEAAWIGGHEVTTVDFDPTEITAADLTQQAIHKNVANVIFAGTELAAELDVAGYPTQIADDRSVKAAKGSDQNRQIGCLSGASLLSEAQKTKVNGHLPVSKKDAMRYLPPSLRSKIG